jgi:hypothetical protein
LPFHSLKAKLELQQPAYGNVGSFQSLIDEAQQMTSYAPFSPSLARMCRRGALALLVTSALGSASAQEAPSDEQTHSLGDLEIPASRYEEGHAEFDAADMLTDVNIRTLARIERGPSNYVEWFSGIGQVDRQSNSGAGIGIEIGVRYPDRPLVAAKFVETHTPLEVYLAVADVDGSVPELLLTDARKSAIGPSIDRDTRIRLKAKNDDMLRGQFSGIGSISAGDVPPVGCSASFKNWVGEVYGTMSCGVDGPPGGTHFTTTTRFDTYCNTPGCDYPLGEIDQAQCTPKLSSCDIVHGTLYNRKQRLTDWRGDTEIIKDGFLQHYGAANCSGDGNVVFSRTHGDQPWVTDAIRFTSIDSLPVGSMVHYYRGYIPVPAQAELLVSYGLWQNGVEAGEAGYTQNRARISNNEGVNDRAILCGDIAMEYLMTDGSPGSCHGPGVHLCTGGSNCTSPCFYCSGGTCN